MDAPAFTRLLDRMTRAAEAGDGTAFAACFTEDATYHDYVYGPHAGRAEIGRMLVELFRRDAGPDYRWEMLDPVCAGDTGYAWSLSSFTSTVPEFAGRIVVIDGISRFRLRDGLIAEYFESVNGCVAMGQLGVAPERMAQVARKWADRLLARPETAAFEARATRPSAPPPP
ncbi:MAG TPA: nuclear transport factor 2 family protein [Burkholderiaceae bacterium]|nr:nuclear transport factor 2 family protein [Burkholderiaceae bacterium]